jgi:hypothetical protein
MNADGDRGICEGARAGNELGLIVSLSEKI